MNPVVPILNPEYTAALRGRLGAATTSMPLSYQILEFFRTINVRPMKGRTQGTGMALRMWPKPRANIMPTETAPSN